MLGNGGFQVTRGRRLQKDTTVLIMKRNCSYDQLSVPIDDRIQISFL
jgi:hypothetical protein